MAWRLQGGAGSSGGRPPPSPLTRAGVKVEGQAKGATPEEEVLESESLQNLFREGLAGRHLAW